jgi:hypothetical protein
MASSLFLPFQRHSLAERDPHYETKSFHSSINQHEFNGITHLKRFLEGLDYFMLSGVNYTDNIILITIGFVLVGGNYFTSNGHMGSIWTPSYVNIFTFRRDFFDASGRCPQLVHMHCQELECTPIVPKPNSLIMRCTDKLIRICGIPAQLVNCLSVSFELN